MAKYSTSEFKNGLKVIIDGIPFNIIDHEFVKPGKGQAFTRIKIKNLLNSRVIEKTFKSGETVEAADIVETEMQYLYNDGSIWHFMSPKDFEQYEIDKEVVADSAMWLKEQDLCNVILFNGAAISVVPPNFVTLEIIETDPGVRGDTSGGGSKPAKLSGGAVVKIPLFVQTGEHIKVDTRTGEYVSRVKV